MKLIAGLGNPGPRYEQTRHNVGFLVVDELARRWKVDISAFDRHYEALLGEGMICGERVMLLKPQTFMNLSGRSVRSVQQFFKLALGELMIVIDDLDLPVGRIRVRGEGSGGGHRGMNDVIAKCGSQEIPRIRIGIGKVHRSETVDYVLSKFAPDEREPVEHAIVMAADATECWLKDGTTAAMNKFNRRE